MTAPRIPPLRFSPIFKEKVWGGRRLAEVAGLELPPGARVGEAWILSDREGDRSAVRGGAFDGVTLRDLLAEHRASVLGGGGGTRPFPLLVKFLDAGGPLSVQVHPDDADAAREGESDPGKDECWLVLRAGERARVRAGLRDGVGEADLRRALERGDPSPCLREVAVREGDLLPIPAGTVHAIEDAVLLEVQTNSDLTYRLHDWDRDARAGASRPLHLEKGLRAVRTGARPVPTRGAVRMGRAFSLEVVEGTRLRAGGTGRPTVVVPLDGSGTVASDGAREPWAAGDAWLLAAGSPEARFESGATPSRWAVAVPGGGAP